jgi:hypothetical protein
MDSEVTFDTLKYAETLRTSGVPDAQAKAQAEALVVALHQVGQDLATRTDLKTGLNEIKTGLAELEARIQATLNRHLLAVMGLMVALIAMYAAIVKLL